MSTEEGHQPHLSRSLSFDDLARGLAEGSISRGRAMKLMGAALLGGVLASIPGMALANHRPNHTAGGGGGGCTAPKVRVGGQCVCPSGQTDCSGACVDLNTDRSNCGKCGNQCPEGVGCEAGSCPPVSPPPPGSQCSVYGETIT